MGEPIRERWVAEAVVGKDFAEVGGLWGTINEQVTIAAAAGATATTMIDVAPVSAAGEDDLWDLFRQRAEALGVTDTTCVQGNIDDHATVERAGSFDVVSCSGVLYHCPDPLRTLTNLRRITRETLILGTASIPETIAIPAGTLSTAPGTAMLVPALSHSQKAVLGSWLNEMGEVEALGVNVPLQGEWTPADYSAWWWFFTRDYVAGLLSVAGFTVERTASYWNGRASLFLAKAT